MLTRLNVNDNEKPEAARKRFDGQLAVHSWARPGHDMADTEHQDDTKAPWWWSKAEADQSADFFMEMARAKGMI